MSNHDIPATTDSRLIRRKKAFDVLTEQGVHVLDLAADLFSLKIISLDEYQRFKSSEDKKLELFKLLESASKKEIVSLVDYEWQLLPVQKIQLTIVHSSGIKEYLYEYSY